MNVSLQVQQFLVAVSMELVQETYTSVVFHALALSIGLLTVAIIPMLLRVMNKTCVYSANKVYMQ